MAWEGKAFWAGLGWIVGGPVGGIIGAIIGAGLDEEAEKEQAKQEAIAQIQAERFARRQQLLFNTLFSLAAKMAKADNVVGKEEIVFLTGYMKETIELSPELQKEAIQIFNSAKNSPVTPEEYARQFYAEFRDEKDALYHMVHLLFYVAAADSVLHINEEKMLKSICHLFQISDDEFTKIKIDFFGDTDQWYVILNCTVHDDDETIKKQYRKLVLEYHPDRIASKNLSKELMEAANYKSQQINEAYRMIKKQRNM
jgi:DnaJ like chaperone protein